jgi:hypothetical protein
MKSQLENDGELERFLRSEFMLSTRTPISRDRTQMTQEIRRKHPPASFCVICVFSRLIGDRRRTHRLLEGPSTVERIATFVSQERPIVFGIGW